MKARNTEMGNICTAINGYTRGRSSTTRFRETMGPSNTETETLTRVALKVGSYMAKEFTLGRMVQTTQENSPITRNMVKAS